MAETESMKRSLSLGYSPCPNDTYIFYALAQGCIDTAPLDLHITLADVEVLNHKAHAGELDVSKVSMHAILHLLDRYVLLKAGGALGRGCGPLVIARQKTSMEALRHKPVAIPGRYTTANLLLQLCGMHDGPCVEMVFDQIMPAVARGDVEAGVIIHEGRFTYPALGLELVLDLGQWWESETGFPLPLGGIVVKRSLGEDTARFLEGKIRESLSYARANPGEPWPYIRNHAQEMEPDVIRRHIEMFVNDFSFNVGQEGEEAVKFLLQAAARLEGIPFPNKPVFHTGRP